MKLYTIGKYVNTHGLKGEIKIKSDTDFDRFNKGNYIYICTDNKNLKFEIKSYRVHKGLHMLTLEGINNINDIEHLKGSLIKVDESQMEELDDGEFYYLELVGKEVVDTEGNKLGVVSFVNDYPQGAMLEIKRKEEKNLIIPFIDKFIVEVNDNDIIVDLPEGLL